MEKRELTDFFRILLENGGIQAPPPRRLSPRWKSLSVIA